MTASCQLEESHRKQRWCRAVTYRLYPTARQTQALVELLAGQRELYNAALEERRGAWRWERRSVTRFDQFRELTGAAEMLPVLGRFGVRVARGTLVRLDEAFGQFYRRIRAGERAGFPRFRGPGSWDSVQWSDMHGWKLSPLARALMAGCTSRGVGHVKVKLHRSFSRSGSEMRTQRR